MLCSGFFMRGVFVILCWFQPFKVASDGFEPPEPVGLRRRRAVTCLMGSTFLWVRTCPATIGFAHPRRWQMAVLFSFFCNSRLSVQSWFDKFQK